MSRCSSAVRAGTELNQLKIEFSCGNVIKWPESFQNVQFAENLGLLNSAYEITVMILNCKLQVDDHVH